jgi:hypothetical protein
LHSTSFLPNGNNAKPPAGRSCRGASTSSARELLEVGPTGRRRRGPAAGHFAAAGNFARDRNDGLWFALSSKRGWFVLRDAKEIEHKSIRTEHPDGGAPVTSFVHVDRTTMGLVEVAARELVGCHFVDEYPDCDERKSLGLVE